MEDEINLFDIFSVIKDKWKTILGVGFAGVIVSGGFLIVVPPQYEAYALVEMAQVRTTNTSNNADVPPSISIETPAMLVERLKSPSTYTSEVIKTCGLVGQLDSPEGMAEMAKTALTKNLISVVSINVRRGSPDQAKQCVEAVFEMIRSQQADLVKPYQAEWKTTLTKLQSRLRENDAFVAKAEKVGLYQTIYLAKRDESTQLKQQIDELERALSRNIQTRLVSPIYASSNPVFPKRTLALALGAMVGLMVGLLVVLGQKVLMNPHAKDRD